MASHSRAGRPWKTLGKRQVLDGSPWVQVFQETVELPSGRTLPDFFKVQLPPFVVVVALTPSDEFLLVGGYKHGLGKVTWGPPAGHVEMDESPRAAAERELLEETGYASEEWEELGNYIVDPNRECGWMHLFRAKRVHLYKAPDEDDAEELDVQIVSRVEVMNRLRMGAFDTLVAAMALGQAMLHP